MTTVDLAIVIVSYNAREDLQACLSRLRDDAPRATHQTVVVDNASTDGSADAARAYGPGCARDRCGRQPRLRPGDERRYQPRPTVA